MGKYRKKLVEIEAFRWTGGPDQLEDPEWIVDAIKVGTVRFCGHGEATAMLIETIGGTDVARIGDWIILDNKGFIYSCKPNIFEFVYDKVEE